MSDLINREAVLKGISLSCIGQSNVIKAEAALVRYVEKIPSAEPEKRTQERTETHACDLISRQDVIKAVLGSNFSACTVYGRSEEGMATAKELIQAIKNLPSAEPERKKPDHGYMWICPKCGLEVHSDFSRCVRCGWDRLSAEPERKRGRWEHIYIKRRGYTRDDRTPRTRESAYCTACRAIVPELKKISRGDSKYRTICNVFNFCPNCGARMEE